MQTVTTASTVAERRCDNAEPITIRKRIGSIVYDVEVHFAHDATETFNDKVLRLMRREKEAAS